MKLDAQFERDLAEAISLYKSSFQPVKKTTSHIMKAASAYHAILPDLRKLVEAREKATPGEWKTKDIKCFCGSCPTGSITIDCDASEQITYDTWKQQDANFAATAANATASIGEKLKP